MPLNGAGILNSPTTAFTGGTAVTLTLDGKKITNGINLIDASVTDYRTRPNVAMSVRVPQIDPTTKKWTKANKTASLTFPKVLADGSQEFPAIKIIMKDHPEMSAAEVQKMKDWACQVINDTDFSSFWSAGSLA